MGLPPEDYARIHRWAERQTAGQDPDVAGTSADETADASVEMALYFIELAGARRSSPDAGGEDLFSLILATEVDGAPMDDISVGSFCVQLVTAGNDTTRTMLSSGLDALLDHPDQLAALRADRTRLGTAIEEILRFANPLHYFRRTAVADTVLHDTPIAAGQKVAMLYTSANRDEAVFADNHAFDVGRDPNPHLSFGIGAHFCLGAHLARLEGRVFFDELLTRFPTIERTGAPRRIRSNLNNGLKELPLRLVAA
jgi:cytochrome P450